MSEQDGAPSQDAGGESTATVLVALGANAGIAVAKGFAAALSGSAAMAAETAHSVVATVNELLLLAALKRSERPPDRRRPFGYGPERFFWSFVAAVSGTDRVLVCARVDLVDDLDTPGVERAMLTMDRALRERFADVAEVFLGPVPRSDPQLRQEVRDRYGDRVAQAIEAVGDAR